MWGGGCRFWGAKAQTAGKHPQTQQQKDGEREAIIFDGHYTHHYNRIPSLKQDQLGHNAGQSHLYSKVAYNVAPAAHSPRPGGGLGEAALDTISTLEPPPGRGLRACAKSVGKLDAIALDIMGPLTNVQHTAKGPILFTTCPKSG